MKCSTRFLAPLVLTFVPLIAHAGELPPYAPPLPAGITAKSISTESHVTVPFDVPQVGGDGMHASPQYGDVARFELSGAAPEKIVKSYGEALRSAGWDIMLEPPAAKVLTARSNDSYQEHWVELCPAGAVVQLTALAYVFNTDALYFGEGENIETRLQKFKGRFNLESPREARADAAAEDDFPFLRHFPGFVLRSDLSRPVDGIHIKETNFTKTGNGMRKVYVNAHGGTPSVRQFFAYQYALSNAGWKIVDTDFGMMTDEPWILARYDVGAQSIWTLLELRATSATYTAIVAPSSKP